MQSIDEEQEYETGSENNRQQWEFGSARKPTFFASLAAVEEECDSPKLKKIMKINVDNVSEGDVLSEQSDDLYDTQKRKRNKKGGFIELRDLAESDFLDLIDSKN